MSQPWCYKWVGGHTSQKNWMRVRGPLPKTLSLFRPKSVIFPYFYAIWPKIRYPTFDRCGWHGCRKYNLWRAFVDGLTVQFKTRVQNHTLFMIKMAKIDSPIMTKTAKKTIPFGVAHKREYSPGPMDQLPYWTHCGSVVWCHSLWG